LELRRQADLGAHGPCGNSSHAPSIGSGKFVSTSTSASVSEIDHLVSIVQCGADIVYSEEVIDRKIITTTRSINTALGTVDFTTKSGDIAFQTLTDHAEPVVFQVGTADAVLALQAANMVAGDIRAFDVNMGCPVMFSTQGGMGSSLLIKPDTVADILSTLKRNLNIPITCKIRLLRDEKKSVELLKRIESCGVSAVGIHARHVSDRPRWRAMPESVVPVLEAANLQIPVLYNGDAFVHSDIERLKSQTKTESVMIGRGAMWNPYVFQAEYKSVLHAIQQYLAIAERYQNKFANTKYVVNEMAKPHFTTKAHQPLAEAFTRCKDHAQLLEAVSLVQQPSNHIASLCDDDIAAFTTSLPQLLERPWVLDPSLEPIPEYDANGCAMSVSNIGKKRQASHISSKPADNQE
jgi:tRNA-dihydrouridine synthase 2